MTIENSIALRHPRFWQVLAWLMLAATVWVTLTPSIPRLSLALLSWDKAQHAITYCWLMWWCVQAFRDCRPLVLAALLCSMGLALELLQNQTGVRHMELGDMIANGVGILTGYVLWRTPLGRTLRSVEFLLARRRLPAQGHGS